jgi:hypothetical protein
MRPRRHTVFLGSNMYLDCKLSSRHCLSHDVPLWVKWSMWAALLRRRPGGGVAALVVGEIDYIGRRPHVGWYVIPTHGSGLTRPRKVIFDRQVASCGRCFGRSKITTGGRIYNGCNREE